MAKKFLIKTEGKKMITNKRFQKEIYTSQDESHRGTVVIHYMGDEMLSIPSPNGYYLRVIRICTSPKPSVTKTIEDSVKGNSDKLAHKIDKETLTEDQSVTDKNKEHTPSTLHKRKS